LQPDGWITTLVSLVESMHRLSIIFTVERLLIKSQDFRVGCVRKTGDIFWKNQPILQIFTIRMFANGSEIMPQEVCWNWKSVADF
jgi:hypothetical protein